MYAAAILQAAAQSLGHITVLNGAGTTARGTSEGGNVQQPAYSAPQLQASGRGAYSASTSAPASASGQAASIQTPAVSANTLQQGLAAPSLPSATVAGVPGQQAAVTGLQSPAAQLTTSPPAAPSQGSLTTSGNPGQQLTEGQSSAAAVHTGQQQVAGKPLQKSVASTQQVAEPTQSGTTTATSRQQAGLSASQDTSLATASAEDDSKEQVHNT